MLMHFATTEEKLDAIALALGCVAKKGQGALAVSDSDNYEVGRSHMT